MPSKTTTKTSAAVNRVKTGETSAIEEIANVLGVEMTPAQREHELDAQRQRVAEGQAADQAMGADPQDKPASRRKRPAKATPAAKRTRAAKADAVIAAELSSPEMAKALDDAETVAAELQSVKDDATVAVETLDAAKKSVAKPAAKKSTAKSKAAPKARVNAAKTAETTPKALLNAKTKAAVKEHVDATRYARKSRTTGTTVALFDNRKRQFFDSDDKWFTVCIEHGSILPSKNINEASDWAPHVALWCPTCVAAAAAKSETNA